ncbi:MAG: 4-hydroxy-tetrahydrodipicolinate synthase [Firmicutes bacterium]|nr:4-hydroxy-tetrahydrodipicolinate synthase [Bacillota bacterium]
MKKFGRVLTAMVTPFTKDLQVDYEGAARLAQYLTENGSDGLVVAGTTGESPTLTHEEKLKLFSTVVDAVGGKAAVIAGTGSNNTQESVEFTRQAAKTGVDGILLVAPYYNKPSQEGLFQHFKAIAASCELPMMLYNIPGRTSVNIQPATVARLAQIPNIVAVKDATGDLAQVTEVRRLTPPDFAIYSGDDALTLPILAVGGAGVVSVSSHLVGKQIQEMIGAFFAGDVAKAAQINQQIFALNKALFITTNPVPVKTALNLVGRNVGGVRQPLWPMSDAELEVLKREMHNAGLM